MLLEFENYHNQINQSKLKRKCTRDFIESLLGVRFKNKVYKNREMCFGTGDKDNEKKWVAKGELSELITINDNFSIVK